MSEKTTNGKTENGSSNGTLPASSPIEITILDADGVQEKSKKNMVRGVGGGGGVRMGGWQVD